MNALQPLDTIEVSRYRNRKPRKTHSLQTQNPLVAQPTPTKSKQQVLRERQAITTELTVKLVLSWIVTSAAIASLCKLVPYHFSQQAKLQEIDTTVQETQKRVNLLRNEFNRNFDPQQTVILMKEYSSKLDPNQSRVFWVEPKTTESLIKN
jgi:hypothetical protein